MRRFILALLTTAILLGVAPASAQGLPVRVSLLREREMLTLLVQASDPASLLDFRFQYLDDYDREILIALRDYDQFRESSAGVTEACFVLRDFETETPVPQECLNITQSDLHVQELGTASLFWFDDVINLQRPLTILDVNGFVGVCPAENARCEFEYPHAPPGEPPAPPLLFGAADLDNREILVLIAEFEQISGSPLQPHLEWQHVLDDAIAEVGVNARAELLPQTIRSHDEARTAAYQYGATLVIWGYVGAAAVSSQYTVTPRWSQVQAQPGETEVIGTLDELALFVSPGGDVEYVFNFVMAQLVYFTKSDYETALTLIDQAIALAPAGREIEMGLGALYFSRGDTLDQLGAPPETRIKAYTCSIDLDPDYALTYNNRGIAYNDLGDYERAIDDYNQAIGLDPEFAFAYKNRGNAYAYLGDYERAIDDYNQAIALYPAYALAYNNRGNVYAYLGDYEQAIEDYEQAIAFDPELALAYTNRGLAYADLGDYERAIDDYEQAIALDPELALAYINRGNAYYALGDYEQAIADFDQVITLDPEDALAYTNRGLAYADLGEYERAIADYDQAIALDSAYARAYYNRGNAYYDLRDYEQAIDDYDQAIALDPAYARPYFNRGNAYYTLGDYERAIADYDQVIALDPAYALAYNNRGLAYDDLGDHERAMADYDQAIALDPGFALAYNNRGLAYYTLNDLRAAYQDFTRAVEIDPNYANAYASLVLVNADKGYCDEAADALDRYLELAGEGSDPRVEDYYRQQCGG